MAFGMSKNIIWPKECTFRMMFLPFADEFLSCAERRPYVPSLPDRLRQPLCVACNLHTHLCRRRTAQDVARVE